MTRRRVAVLAATAYMAALVTATHWPGVTIEGPVPRPDLWVHVGAFGLWALLAAWAWHAVRRWPVGLTLGLTFAAADEATQTLFGRQASWTDFAADCVGVCIGLATFQVIFNLKRGDQSRTSIECSAGTPSAGEE